MTPSERVTSFTRQTLMKFDERLKLAGVPADERRFYYSTLQDAMRDGDEFLALLDRIEATRGW